MSLVQGTIWEVRTTGNNANGGGFNNRIPGTSVDYSQQNAPQLSLNDLACAMGSVTVTSAVGGFTNAMAGNIIQITGGVNFVTGFYEIVQWNNANSVNLDRSPCPAGVGANGVGNVGGGLATLVPLVGVIVQGNIVYIQGGIYAAHPSINLAPVTTFQYPIVLWGYDTVRGNPAVGANRPYFQMGANTFRITTMASKLRNIRISSSNLNVLGNTGISYQLLENCYLLNTLNVGASRCFYQGVAGELTFIDCEFEGTAGAASIGIYDNYTYISPTIINCYFHDLTNGVQIGIASASGVHRIFFNIFARCDVGIYTEGKPAKCLNNTFTSMGRSGYQDISGLANGAIFINNIFADCLVAGIEAVSDVIMNNNFHNCGAPVIGSPVYAFDDNLYLDPQFTAPPNQYSLMRTSGLIDKAFSMRLGV